MHFSAFLTALAVSAPLVAGHAAIVKAVGDAGGSGQALGVDDTVPRTGTGRNPFQADSTRFKGDAADGCGETLKAGDNNPTAQVGKMVAAGVTMPQITAGGQLMMTLHQVNGDGAGPYDCAIDSTGAGTNWQKITVGTQVPGTNSRSQAKATDFPLTAQIPANQKCTGSMAGVDNMCMVKCKNAARAGPFGGCVPVQMASGANATAAVAAREAREALAAGNTRRALPFSA